MKLRSIVAVPLPHQGYLLWLALAAMLGFTIAVPLLHQGYLL